MTSHHPSLARSRRKVLFTNLAVIHQLTGPSGKRSKHSGGIESDDTRISNPRVVSFLSPSKLRCFTCRLSCESDWEISDFHYCVRPFFSVVRSSLKSPRPAQESNFTPVSSSLKIHRRSAAIGSTAQGDTPSLLAESGSRTWAISTS